MTNKELRDLLEQFDDDLPVEIFQWDRDITFEIYKIIVEECEPHYTWEENHLAIVLK